MAFRPFTREPITLPGRAALPAVSLALVGDTGAGKTTLLVALTHALARRGWAPRADFDQLDVTPYEHERGSSITLSHVRARSERRRLVWIDCPGHSALTRNAYNGIAQADQGVLVVAADQGLMPQSREHVRLAAHLGVSDWVVYISKLDAAGVNEELLELSELEVREFFNSLELEGDGLTILRGAPRAALESGLKTHADSLWALLDAVDSLPLPRRDVDAPLLMPVADTFSRYRPRAVIVTGKLARGAVELGESIELLGYGERWRGEVTSLHRERVPATRATAGDHAGLLLEGRTVWNTRRGHVVAAPESVTPRDTLRAELRMLTTAEGGYGHAVFRGFRPQLHVHTADVATRLDAARDRDFMFSPGEPARVVLELQHPIVALAAQPIVLRASRATVALGAVVND